MSPLLRCHVCGWARGHAPSCTVLPPASEEFVAAVAKMLDTPAPVTGETTDAREGERGCRKHPESSMTGDNCPVCRAATPDADDASERKGRRHVTTTRSVGTATVALDDADNASEVEALAHVMHEAERLYDWPSDRARHILASDWLAARVSAAATRAADDRAERIARAIEAEPLMSKAGYERNRAVRIARTTP